MSRIEIRPDPPPENTGREEPSPRRARQPEDGRDARAARLDPARAPSQVGRRAAAERGASPKFDERLTKPRAGGSRETAEPPAERASDPDDRLPLDLPLLDRPLPGDGPAADAARRATEKLVASDSSVGERAAEGVSPDRTRRLDADRDGPSSAESPIDPGQGPAPGPPVPPSAATAAASPGAPRVLDPALLQQVVQFAAVTRNTDGQRELVLGTGRDFLGGVTLRLVALGGGRVALRYRPGTDATAAREGVSRLARSMRERGVDLVDVQED